MKIMREPKKSVLFTVLFLIFIGIMDYPFVSRMYNEHVQGQVVSAYEEAEQSLDEAAYTLMRQEAESYNKALADGAAAGLEDAFSGNGEEDDGAYYDLLSSGDDGVMGILRIPKIQVELPVYHGTSENVLQKGVGHLEGSSLPVGGGGTHVCLSAHRGLPSKILFTNLDQVGEGDVFYLRVLGETMAYEVYGTQTVLPHETEALTIRPGEDLVTLITCTPYGINTHRIYVHGKRIPYEEEAEQQEQREAAGENFWNRYWWAGVTLLLLLWMGVLLYRINRRDPEEITGQEKDVNYSQ